MYQYQNMNGFLDYYKGEIFKLKDVPETGRNHVLCSIHLITWALLHFFRQC